MHILSITTSGPTPSLPPNASRYASAMLLPIPPAIPVATMSRAPIPVPATI